MKPAQENKNKKEKLFDKPNGKSADNVIWQAASSKHAPT